jgi:hypothetical protein
VPYLPKHPQSEPILSVLMSAMDEESEVNSKSAVVHPLVIASACDHYTRVSMGGSKLASNAPVYGLLFGYTATTAGEQGEKQMSINICDSTDAIYEVGSNSSVTILAENIKTKIQLWTAVFTEYRLVGWYAFGNDATVEHIKFHKSIESFMTTDHIKPVFMLMKNASATVSATTDPSQLQLPMTVLELIRASNSEVFVTMPFKLQTTPVEQIAVDQIIKSVPAAAGLTEQEVRNQSTVTSLSILQSKTDLMIETMGQMERGEIPVNHELIRKAAKIAHLLVRPYSTEEKQAQSGSSGLKGLAGQTLEISYLSAASKTMHNIGEIAGLYHLAYGDNDRNLH